MISKIVKITFKYCYVDNMEGNYEDLFYHKQSGYVKYDNEDFKKITELYIHEKDKSIILKDIIKIENLGLRLFKYKSFNKGKYG